MKLKSILTAMALCLSGSMVAADIVLPEPQKEGGMPLMEAIAKRKSDRQFDASKELSAQQLSNMLWVAWGFNREGKRTVPTAMDRQEVSVYLITKDAAYLYDAASNTLKQVNSGDFRKHAAAQPFAQTALYNVALVSDKSKQEGELWQGVSVGAVSQNIYLWCASEGLNTVVRGSFDRGALGRDLKLSENQTVLLVQTVGF